MWVTFTHWGFLSNSQGNILLLTLTAFSPEVAPVFDVSLNVYRALTKRSRYISLTEDIQVTTLPSKWPGVDNLVALLTREKDEETPQLRLLLAETLFAVSAFRTTTVVFPFFFSIPRSFIELNQLFQVAMSLFSYAFTAYDSRWLYRLAAHAFDAKQFANVFGGGGEKKFKTVPPRPPG